jgi:hypothetical protein
MDQATRDLLGEIRRIPIIDTHDHLEEPGDCTRLRAEGFGVLLHYVGCDLMASGHPGTIVRDPAVDPRERFDSLEPHWRHLRYGAYMRTLERGLEAVHGIDRLTRGTCAELEGRMMRFYAGGGHARALKELANIELAMIDPLEPHVRDERAVSHRGLGSDPDYFLCDYHERITGDFATQSARLADDTGIAVTDLASWKRAFAEDLARAAPFAPGIKCTLGYSRVLDFSPVSEAEAAPLAARALRGQQLTDGEFRALTDHFVDAIAGLAADHGLPMKFHTGLHAGGWNHLDRADPEPLLGLIRRHPRTRFDLFHIAYPYYREAAVMAKYYPNVTVDLCWAWAFSPHETEQALNVLLDLVPVNKIFGFGGDYYHLEGVVGHALVAREGIARVLAERVRQGRHREADAVEIARAILHDSPAEHFAVERKRAALRAARAARPAPGR